jgi:hypothetical protein
MKISELLNEDWNKVNKKDKTDGLSQKAVNAYRRENPGSKLKTAVTTKPSKLKAGSKDAKRRKSFCARMSGNKGPMKKPNGKPTPKALALRRWNCESIEEMRQLIEHAEQVINEEKQKGVDGKACWDGYKRMGTKKKGGKTVDNCVKMEENFADGKNPQDKGDAKRHGVNTKASVSSLRKTAKQGGRKGQLAHWMANMKAGRAKKK